MATRKSGTEVHGDRCGGCTVVRDQSASVIRVGSRLRDEITGGNGG